MKKMFVLLLLTPMLAWADDWSVTPVLGIDAQFGGDTIETIVYTDNTEQDLLAGNGLVFVGGVLVDLPLDNTQLHTSLGFKYSTSAATNVDVNKIAWPLEVGLRYTLDNGLFAEAGAVKHLAASYTSSGAGFNRDDEYDTSIGLNLKAG
ncbi:hypothetical protein [Saccharospirillum mangrovi]|uniref:hypothetical protein n=1 Tax=Saccharospirillum mangrovi TaxID=2161747 RepID=UPI000D3C8C14|nr:hypothetical protein [Saccharospirillum mangrovi]